MLQIADAEAVVRSAVGLPGIAVLALVPNLKGAERAFAVGAHRLTVPVSASRLHSQQNIGMTPEQAIGEVARMVALRDGLEGRGLGRRGRPVDGFRVHLGRVGVGRLDDPSRRDAAEAGADSVGLSDTTGYGNPAQVKRLFRHLWAALGPKAAGAHFHNTRGQGLANVVAALDGGVTTFDSSQGGLGGCPSAPGASGNIVTEDLVFPLEAMGLRTGIDMDRLLAARSVITEALPGEAFYGHVADAGLPEGFNPASAQRSAA